MTSPVSAMRISAHNLTKQMEVHYPTSSGRKRRPPAESVTAFLHPTAAGPHYHLISTYLLEERLAEEGTSLPTITVFVSSPLRILQAKAAINVRIMMAEIDDDGRFP